MNHTVLLVDDDANILHGLARVLRHQPYQLFTARSGDEAMAILRTRSIDVIVSDEQMPGISGSDLLAWVADNYTQRGHKLRFRVTVRVSPNTVEIGASHSLLLS